MPATLDAARPKEAVLDHTADCAPRLVAPMWSSSLPLALWPAAHPTNPWESEVRGLFAVAAVQVVSVAVVEAALGLRVFKIRVARQFLLAMQRDGISVRTRTMLSVTVSAQHSLTAARRRKPKH